MPSIFDIPPEKLRRWRIGEPVDANKLNQPVEVLNKMLRGVRPARQISPRAIPVSAGAEVRRFKVRFPLSVGAAVVCEDATTDVEVRVAIPTIFQHSFYVDHPRNGITYRFRAQQKRYADSATETELQEIVPSYLPGDIIYAVKPVNGTGLTILVGEVLWMDLNVDGRVWSKEFGT